LRQIEHGGNVIKGVKQRFNPPLCSNQKKRVQLAGDKNASTSAKEGGARSEKRGDRPDLAKVTKPGSSRIKEKEVRKRAAKGGTGRKGARGTKGKELSLKLAGGTCPGATRKVGVLACLASKNNEGVEWIEGEGIARRRKKVVPGLAGGS